MTNVVMSHYTVFVSGLKYQFIANPMDKISFEVDSKSKALKNAKLSCELFVILLNM